MMMMLMMIIVVLIFITINIIMKEVEEEKVVKMRDKENRKKDWGRNSSVGSAFGSLSFVKQRRGIDPPLSLW